MNLRTKYLNNYLKVTPKRANQQRVYESPQQSVQMVQSQSGQTQFRPGQLIQTTTGQTFQLNGETFQMVSANNGKIIGGGNNNSTHFVTLQVN